MFQSIAKKSIVELVKTNLLFEPMGLLKYIVPLPFKLLALYTIEDDISRVFIPVFETFLTDAILDPDSVNVELIAKINTSINTYNQL